MLVEQVFKQSGGKLYGNHCVQLSARIRRALGLQDGDRVKVHMHVYEPKTKRSVGDASFEAVLTSGGELYVGGQVVGARPGHQVDLVLL